MTVRIGVLGAFEVTRDGTELEPGGPQPQALLAMLALRAGRVVSTDALLAELWPARPPAEVRGTLQTYVSRLRRHLEPDRELWGDAAVLSRVGDGYRLQVDEDHVDALRFEHLLAAARVGGLSPQERVRQLDDALSLWRDRALEGVATGPTLEADAARLDELRVSALEERAAADLALGRSAAAATALEPLATLHPLRERLHALLIVALARTGRPADALATYRRLRSSLVDELGLEPSTAVRDLEVAILRGEAVTWRGAPPSAMGAGTPRALPTPASRLVGRSEAVTAATELVRHARLVTLVGTGGIGKTRLALAVANQVSDQATDGAWFVELSPVSDERYVVNAVLAGLGLAERPGRDPVDVLIEHLREQQALLLVDGCEHVVPAVGPLIARVLTKCPGVRVLATSRRPLRTAGERLVEVPPLEVGDGSQALELFLDRARAVRPDLELDEEQLQLARDVCRRVDGLPLALELAASQLRAMPLRELAERLDDRFAVLTQGDPAAPARHQTLEATIDWSFAQLPDDEQRLFTRLSIFRGGFTADAVRHVCLDDDTDPTEPLAALVEHSLVRPPDPDGRFGMLDTLREFGALRVEAAGDHELLAERHARHVLDLVARADRGIRGPDQHAWRRRLDAEHANLRAAVTRGLRDGGAPVALGIAARAWRFWYRFDRTAEGLDLSLRALDTFDPESAPRPWAWVAVGAGHLAWLRGDHELTRQCYEQAIEAAGDSRDGRLCMGQAHALAGMRAVERGELDDADRAFRQADVAYRDAGADEGPVSARAYRAVLALQRGDLDAARDRFTESLERFTADGDVWEACWARWGLARVATERGEPGRALALHRRNLPETRRIATLVGCAYEAEGLGLAAAALGRHRSAARLLAAAGALRRTLGVVMPACDRSAHERARRAVAEALGPTELDAHTSRGASVDLPEAFEMLAAEGELLADAAADVHVSGPAGHG